MDRARDEGNPIDFSLSVYEPPRWEEHRAVIVDLYDKKELKDVIRLMRERYSFKASENQYKKQITKWGINKKHIKADEYKVMLRKQKQRLAEEGKDSRFILHGNEVDGQNIVRFQDRMLRSGKIDEDNTFSEVATPPGLRCITPVSDEEDESPTTTLKIPPRMTSIHPDASITDIFFISSTHPTTELPSHPHSHSSTCPPPHPNTEPPHFNTDELITEITHFGQLPTHQCDQIFLDFVISNEVHCDDFCTQCTTFGYEPDSGGCLVHRTLGRVLAQYKIEKWSIEKAVLMCRGVVADAAATLVQAPLASLLRLAVDIVWISARAGDVDGVSGLAHLLGIPVKFLGDGQYTYRTLLCICAFILAQNGEVKTAVETLKSVLGPDFQELVTWLYRLGANTAYTTITFDRAVVELTMGRMRAFEDEGGWRFFDYDAHERAAKAWCRDAGGNVKVEELFVRGMALCALVEVENRQRDVKRMPETVGKVEN